MKVVTLDGTVISKAGTMTGGNAPRDAGKSSRWDAQEHSNLKGRRNDLVSEIANADSSRGDLGRITELRTKITQLRSKEEYATKDMTVTKEKITGLQNQVNEVTNQLARVVQDQAKLPPRIADREKTMLEIQQRIMDTEEGIFMDFSQRIGVTNIRDFETGHLQVLRATAERRRKLREQKAKLEAQLLFERTKDFSSPRQKIERRLVQTKQLLTRGKEKQCALVEVENTAANEVRACEEKRDGAKNALEEIEVEVNALQSERSKCSKERVTITKQKTAEETTVEQLRGRLHTILQKAKVEEADLPMISGECDAIMNGANSVSSSRQSELTASTHFSQIDNHTVRRDQMDAERLDFSSLLEHHRVAGTNALPKIKTEYESKLGDLEVEIQQMQPNMKVRMCGPPVLSMYNVLLMIS